MRVAGLSQSKTTFILFCLSKATCLSLSRSYNLRSSSLNSEHQYVSTRIENIPRHGNTHQWWSRERAEGRGRWR